MARAALTKLLILVILAFIICLPEFFMLDRASKVNFHCLPYRPCERGDQVKTGESEKTGYTEIRKEDTCDPLKTPEKWEQVCLQESRSNTRNSRRGSEDTGNSWFLCKTDVDMIELHRNLSSSALKVDFEVSLELQLREAETLNLTLYGHSNHSSLNLHPPEEEEDESNKEDEGQKKAFYHCLSAPPTSESTNQSCCLLWFPNQTVLTATPKEKLPWKRTLKDNWHCVFRVLWLVLLCVVLLIVVITVLGQIYWEKFSFKKNKVQPVGYDYAGHQLNYEENHSDIIIPKGMILHPSRTLSWSELSAIQEVDSQDDTETLLDGTVDQCYTANLHHRSHPSTFSVTEEQAW